MGKMYKQNLAEHANNPGVPAAPDVVHADWLQTSDGQWDVASSMGFGISGRLWSWWRYPESGIIPPRLHHPG
jgi:hypothetical protein